jgi:adenosine deaminase
MNESFQLALRAGDLDAIRLCPKSDLHNHGWAGAELASVAAILGSLGRVETLASHPIRKLYDAGVRVTVNTDDMVDVRSERFGRVPQLI